MLAAKRCWSVVGLMLGALVTLHAQAPAAPAALSAAGKARAAKADLSTPDISGLMNKASDDLQQNLIPQAQSALDGAKAVNATQLGLWEMYGDLNLRKGDIAVAEADYRKELQLHPDFLAAYQSLASAQIEAHENERAVATLREWQEAEPSDTRPTTMLLNLYVDEGKPAEAVKAGEEVVADFPEFATDPAVLFYLGSAECKVGNRSKGIPMLEQALQADDSSVRNSAAYELADLSVDLPQAEAAQRDVIERIGLITEGWLVTGDLLTLRTTTNTLAAAWDTLGWILYREGKLAPAEEYVRASWLNSPHALVGLHLGTIQAARGNRAEALATYKQALATVPKPASGPQPADVAEAVAEIQKRIAAQEKAGVRAAVADPRAALAKMWTLKLGPAGAVKGAAPYRVLMQRGRIVHSAEVMRGAKTLTAGAAVITHADVSEFFPPNPGYAQLVHIGVLRCGATCEFLLEQ